MISPPKDSINLFICDDFRKEAEGKLSLLGIYFNKVISIPKNSDGMISSLCFVVTLNGQPGDYIISFEILKNDKSEHVMFRTPKEETLNIDDDASGGMYAARLGGIKMFDEQHGDYLFKLKINDTVYVFQFKLLVQ
ncbi:hypothetical protein [Aeromonas veronii]|uniref:hypothetical protein n=1 Tax=Aeromonas veronii TaxID=654 RepID=UPI00191DC988|nr:hypothetical protein [Aeromonas veronii]MBL0566533.1 hypothetical protein [Aeromonas veronii]